MLLFVRIKYQLNEFGAMGKVRVLNILSSVKNKITELLVVNGIDRLYIIISRNIDVTEIGT
jgi:hypothetical protein